MEELVEVIKAISEQSLTNDRALLTVVEALTQNVLELTDRVTRLESILIEEED